MATEIAFQTSVDIGEGAKSLRSLKEEFKETQKELDGLTVGSEKYVQTLSKLGKVKDEIGDLNSEIAAFHPEGKIQAFGTVVNGVASGFQAATGAAALFGGENKELEKTLVKLQAVMAFTEGLKGLASLGDGFKVLSNVIKANPIFLIVGVIAAIGGAMYALKDKIGVVGDAFDFLGEIISTVVQGIKDFTDWIGITSNASDDLAAKTISNAKKMGQAVTDRYDLEIAKAQAAGKTTFDLEKQKQEAIIQTLRVEAEAIVAAAKARGNFTDEENKRFTELIASTQKAANEISIIEIKMQKERDDAEEKRTEKIRQEQKKRQDDYVKHLEELRKRDAEILAQQRAEEEKDKQEQEEKRAKEQEAADIAYINAGQKRIEDNKKQIEKENEEKLKSEEALEKSRFEIAQASARSLQSLSDLYFILKMSNVRKGSAEELRAAKQQFKINKALAIQSTIISGIQGVVNALSAQSVIPEPYGTILKVANAVAVGIATAANVAKIASTQFNEGGGGGGSVPSISAPSSQNAPSINAPSSSTTQLNPNGTVKSSQPNTIVIQNNISEMDLTKVQKKTANIESHAQVK